MIAPKFKNLPATAAVHAAMKRLSVDPRIKKQNKLYQLTDLACIRLLKQYGIDVEAK